MFLKGVFKGFLVNICLKNVLKNFDMSIHRAMFLGGSILVFCFDSKICIV